MPSNTNANSFLGGALIDGFADIPLARPNPTSGNVGAGLGGAAARSQTTLDCWHECTVHISGCKKKLTS